MNDKELLAAIKANPQKRQEMIDLLQKDNKPEIPHKVIQKAIKLYEGLDPENHPRITYTTQMEVCVGLYLLPNGIDVCEDWDDPVGSGYEESADFIELKKKWEKVHGQLKKLAKDNGVNFEDLLSEIGAY